MSSINAKNLTYTKQEPAFLRKLRGETANDDRHNVQIPRPTRPKDRLRTNGENEDDDGPVIVDESGEQIEKDEFERMTKTGLNSNSTPNKADHMDDGGGVDKIGERREQQQQVAEIGGSNMSKKKRKVGKAIRDEDDADSKIGKRDIDGTEDAGKGRIGNLEKEDTKDPKSKDVKKNLKQKKSGKKKKIKLSFDEPD